MKYISLFLLQSIFCLVLSGQNPAAVYHFTNGSLEDSSPNAHHLTALAPVVAEEGHDESHGNGLYLRNNAVFIADTDVLNIPGQMTISVWVKQRAVSADWSAIINKWQDSDGSYYLGINPENNRVRWNCFVDNIEDTAALPLGVWVHYTVSFDGQVLKMYRNGELVSSKSTRESKGVNAAEFRIGLQSNNLPDALHYNGDVDEIYIYNVALTGSEVTELYNETLSNTGYDIVLYDLQLGVQTAPSKLKVKGLLLNNSAQELTDVNLEVTVGSNSETLQLSGVTIEPFASYDFDIVTNFDLAVSDELSVQVKAILAAAQTDVNPENNARTELVKGYAFLPERKVVIEEGTGAWCGFCPRGAVAMEEMTQKYPDNFIGIAVHNDDPMVVTAYDDGVNFMNYPNCHVDRVIKSAPISTESADSYIQTRLNNENVPVVAVSHTSIYDPFNRRLIVRTEVQSAVDLSGFYTYSLVITEDGVNSSDPAYAQVNFFANNARGPMGGYENLPDPVPAEDMVYDHVARALIGDYNGAPGSLIQELKVGETYSHTHNYLVPRDFNSENLNIVSLFLDTESGEILNAESSTIAEGNFSDSNDAIDFTNLAIYPNPSNGESYLELDVLRKVDLLIAISDINGSIVSHTNYGAALGYNRIPLAIANAVPGLYLLQIHLDGEIITKKLIIR